MSPKQWFALLCFYISYLFFGASIFYHVEHALEIGRRTEALAERIEINELLVKYAAPNDHQIQNEILEKLSDYCGKPVTNHTTDEFVPPFVWSFYHSFFFSFIVCSTIGYGNISPNNNFGRIFMIFYALIGMPVNGFLFAYMGDFFGKTFISVYKRYKVYKIATTKNYVPQRLNLIGRILLYLIPGIVIFIFLPAVIFCYFEEWSYVVAVYYCFVTLTTIGFGDYVPTFQQHQEHVFGGYYIAYQIFIILWFVAGLGYLVMIMGFIAKGMRSKRLARLEHQLSHTIKDTQNRIWHGVTKDVSFLRRILNEINMMKFKPVYNEAGDRGLFLPRSASCPELSMYRSESPRVIRKRAYSENYTKPLDSSTISTLTLTRIQSDSDLSRIDKQKTFEAVTATNISGPGDILAKVVSALGSIRPVDEDEQSVLDIGMDGGIHGFSDSQILASEHTWSGWSLAQSDSYANPPKHQRTRAASDFRAPSTDGLSNSNEWTWSGNNARQLQEYMRTKAYKNKKDLYRASFATLKNQNNKERSISLNIPEISINPATAPSATNLFINKLNPFKNRLLAQDAKRHSLAGQELDVERYLANTSRGRESKISIGKLNPFKKRLFTQDAKRHSIANHLDIDSRQYLERAARGRESRTSLPRQYLSATAGGRNSIFSILSQPDNLDMEVLEKTTIADLIRALEVVHTKANTNSDTPLLQGYFDAPKRKMGTASLTPPSPPNLKSMKNSDKRRGSLKPVPGYTTIFSSQVNNTRKPSALIGNEKLSRLPQNTSQPPPYTVKDSPKQVTRRFSVRPTNLSTAPGQAPPPSIQAASMLQRRLSLRPSPLARGTNSQASGRYIRQNIPQTSSGTNLRLSTTANPATRNPLWRPAQLHASRTRHGSLSELYEKNDRKRTESK